MALIYSGLGMFATPLMSSMISTSVQVVHDLTTKIKVKDLYLPLIRDSESGKVATVEMINMLKISDLPLEYQAKASYDKFSATRDYLQDLGWDISELTFWGGLAPGYPSYLLNELEQEFSDDISKITDFELPDVPRKYLAQILERTEEARRNREFGVDSIKEIVKSAIHVVNLYKSKRNLPIYDTTSTYSIKNLPKTSREFYQYYDDNSWGGLVYEIVINLPYLGKVNRYIGATEYTEGLRLREHIRDTLKDYTFILNKLRRGETVSKIKLAILDCILKTLPPSPQKTLVNSPRYQRYHPELLRMSQNYKNSIMIDEICERLTSSGLLTITPIELCETVEYAFIQEKDIVEDLGLSSLLNIRIPTGVPRGNQIPLPYSDIVFMVSLGFSTEEICRVLGSEFGIRIARDTLVDHLSRFFKDFNVAQERLLKETIEYFIQLRTPAATTFQLPDANDFVRFLRSLNSVFKGGTISGQWFNDWIHGRVLLDVDYQKIVHMFARNTGKKVDEQIRFYFSRHYGFTWKNFEYWAMKGLTLKAIGDILGVTTSVVASCYQSNGGGYENVQRIARKRVAIDLLARGVDPEIIYTEVWGYTQFDPDTLSSNIRSRSQYLFRLKQVFSELFGMPYIDIVDTNWIPLAEGWAEIYGVRLS